MYCMQDVAVGNKTLIKFKTIQDFDTFNGNRIVLTNEVKVTLLNSRILIYGQFAITTTSQLGQPRHIPK